MKLSGTLLAGTAIFGLSCAGSAPVASEGGSLPDNFVAYIIDADATQGKGPGKIGSGAIKGRTLQRTGPKGLKSTTETKGLDPAQLGLDPQTFPIDPQ